MRESGAQTACRWGWDADFCNYAGAHGIDIIGNAYEERLIDEIASNEKSTQRIEIKIQIA